LRGPAAAFGVLWGPLGVLTAPTTRPKSESRPPETGGPTATPQTLNSFSSSLQRTSREEVKFTQLRCGFNCTSLRWGYSHTHHASKNNFIIDYRFRSIPVNHKNILRNDYYCLGAISSQHRTSNIKPGAARDDSLGEIAAYVTGCAGDDLIT
jgi:hypothetical protein